MELGIVLLNRDRGIPEIDGDGMSPKCFHCETDIMEEEEGMKTNETPSVTTHPPLSIAMMQWKGNGELEPARITFLFAQTQLYK